MYSDPSRIPHPERVSLEMVLQFGSADPGGGEGFGFNRNKSLFDQGGYDQRVAIFYSDEFRHEK